jgi:hypothetical protein
MVLGLKEGNTLLALLRLVRPITLPSNVWKIATA